MVKRKQYKQCFSWEGLEDKRQQLRAAALRYFNADKKAGEQLNSDTVIGSTIRVYKSGKTPTDLKAVDEPGVALRELMELHRILVVDYNLSWDLVRQEWAPILNPHPSELQRCKELVEN